MYDYIKGEITNKTSSSSGSFITVEVSGIGYYVEVTSKDFNSISKSNDVVKVYTVLIHKEDKMALCGFLRRENRDIFNVLTSVSGVGSKMALTLLDSFETTELIGLVIEGNFKALTSAKGVGPKLAQKIILELKDKLMNFKTKQPIKVQAIKVENSQAVEDAQMVLESLGYDNSEIENALSKSLAIVSSDNAEEILKEALKILSI